MPAVFDLGKLLMPENHAGLDPGSWTAFRQEMPIVKRWAYFDHAAIGPLPQSAVDAIGRWATQACDEGDVHWPAWQKQINELRHLAARLINSGEDEICIIPNTTAGINLVANGIHWQTGDNIVTAAGEFPTNLYPWLNLQRLGVETRMVPRVNGRVCLDQIAAACDQRTRLVSLSWVTYDTGFRIDVRRAAQIAHRAGAWFLLDAIQGLGVFPLDARETEIDFLAADGHKWLLGPEGAGVFYIRGDLLDQMIHHNIGWRSVKHEWDFSRVELDWKPGAVRFEGGTSNTPGSIGLLASLQVLERFGLAYDRSPIADRVLECADRLAERLRQRGCIVERAAQRENRSGIVSFQVPGQDANLVRDHLMNDGVVLSCRNQRLRAAVHAYNDENDIDRLIGSIDRLSSVGCT